MTNRSLPLRLLRKPEKLILEKIFRGLSSGVKWKRKIQDVKEGLSTKDLIMMLISNYAEKISPQIERTVLEENPRISSRWFRQVTCYAKDLNPLILDKIEEALESEVLDDRCR